jgi:hypothetical protein
MPVHQSIDAQRRRIIARVHGEFTLDEIIGAIDSALSDPAFETGFDIYSDHLDLEKEITTPQLNQMTVHLKSLIERMSGARWAIVTRAPASYGMMRMFSAHAQGLPMDVRVFDSHDEAETWLASPKA